MFTKLFRFVKLIHSIDLHYFLIKFILLLFRESSFS